MSKMPILPQQSVRDIRRAFRQLCSQTLPMHWLDGWLLAVLDKSAVFLMTDDDYRLTADETAQLNAGIARMMTGEPLAYLLGHQAFWGREFVVNRHTLIPRADTEILVETVLNFAKTQANYQPRILDLGTGSGCIAITLALELPLASVLAVELSADALQVARQNIARLQADNCQAVQSAWYQAVTGRFDIIVSNPPYISDDDEHLAGLAHEPITALVAADDGLADIDVIIKNGREHLSDGGLMVIEHGYRQAKSVRALYQAAGFVAIETVKDYGSNERVTLARWYGGCDHQSDN
ncbi:peptide chain release factor N(5)-glutamine methyltransferase [Moraxella sp. ZJ142]|uniref:peptide chain release factor N(5)-glutamine methyltransferase n=1 Tax=Moraxella marmotae TaxID=3344520 RepID=UPI0035D4C49D